MLLKKVDQKAGEDVGIWKKTCSILGPPKIFLAFPGGSMQVKTFHCSLSLCWHSRKHKRNEGQAASNL